MRDNGPQNHHIVTLSTVDSPIVQEINSLAGRLGVAGFAINSKINIMSLPTNRNVAFSLGISPHLGRTLSSYQTPQFDINDIVAGSRDFSDAQLGDHNVLSKIVSQYYDLAATSRTAILGGNLFPSRPFLTAPALTSSNTANDIFANAYIGGRVIVRSDVADPAFSNPPPESFPASSGFEPLGGFTSAPALDPMEGFNLAPAFENNPGLIAAPAMPALPTSVPVSYPLGPTYSVPLMDVPTFSFPDLNGVPAQNLPDFGQMVGQPVVASPSYPTIAEDQLTPQTPPNLPDDSIRSGDLAAAALIGAGILGAGYIGNAILGRGLGLLGGALGAETVTSPAAAAPSAPALAPSPITAEPASDPPGAAPANADPGQAAPTTSEYGGVAASDPPSDGQGGQTGYGGGQPAYGGYDPDPSNADPGDPGDPDGSGGIGREPIVLDLSGQGIALTQLTSSNQFVVGEDNYQHRTAWAGAGSAVLFVDPNGDNAIRNADQYVFSDWDPSASSDMEALRDVFDTNHDGKLDAGDADFAQFKLMVTNPDGTTSVETLAQAGITSIDLEANSVTRSYADGSSIDGETTYTKTDGSTGTAATVSFEQDANGAVLETPLVTTNPDGSTTIDDATIHPDGSLANETISTTSADGLSKTIAFDDAGNGISDRRETDTTVVGADGSKTETVSDLNGSGVLQDSTATTTSADGSLVTITRDLDGSGIVGQSETRQTAADGSITDLLTDLAADGSTIDQTVTTFSADGLSKFTQVDGTFDRGIGKVASTSASRQGLPRWSGVTGRRHRRRHAFEVLQTREPSDKRATVDTARHTPRPVVDAEGPQRRVTSRTAL